MHTGSATTVPRRGQRTPCARLELGVYPSSATDGCSTRLCARLSAEGRELLPPHTSTPSTGPMETQPGTRAHPPFTALRPGIQPGSCLGMAEPSPPLRSRQPRPLSLGALAGPAVGGAPSRHGKRRLQSREGPAGPSLPYTLPVPSQSRPCRSRSPHPPAAAVSAERARSAPGPAPPRPARQSGNSAPEDAANQRSGHRAEWERGGVSA